MQHGKRFRKVREDKQAQIVHGGEQAQDKALKG